MTRVASRRLQVVRQQLLLSSGTMALVGNLAHPEDEEKHSVAAVHIWDTLTGVQYDVVALHPDVCEYLSIRTSKSGVIDSLAGLTNYEQLLSPGQLAAIAYDLVVVRKQPIGEADTALSPSPELVGRLAEAAIQQGKPYRRELASLFTVSPYTIDDWLKTARRHGYLSPAKMGRPRATAIARRAK